MSLFKRRPLVGLDVQPRRARILQLQRRGKSYRVVLAAACELAANVFALGKIADFDALRQALSQLVQNHGLTGMAAAIQMPAHLVYSKRVRLPVGLSAKEMAELVRQEYNADMPVLKAEVSVEYTQVNQVAGYAHLDCLATRTAYLRNYIECINASGLAVVIVEVDLHALARFKQLTSGTLLDWYDGLVRVADYESQQYSCRYYPDISELAQTSLRKPVCAIHPDFAEFGAYSPQFLTDDNADFILAAGLALREVPRCLI